MAGDVCRIDESSIKTTDMSTTYRFTRTFYLQGPLGDLARFKVTEGSDIVQFSCKKHIGSKLTLDADDIPLSRDAARAVYRSLSKWCDIPWQALTTADGENAWNGIIPDPEVIALTW